MSTATFVNLFGQEAYNKASAGDFSTQLNNVIERVLNDKSVPDGEYKLNWVNQNGLYRFSLGLTDKRKREIEDRQRKEQEIANSYHGGGLMYTGEEEGDPADKNGLAVSVFNGAAAFGLLGIMIDFGTVSDSYGKSSTYFTFGWMKGYGAAAGSGLTLTNKNLALNNFEGWASGFMFQIPFTPVGLEGYTDISKGAIDDHYGQSLKGFGANIGPGAIWGWYNSYTILVPSLPNDFWTRPGRH